MLVEIPALAEKHRNEIMARVQRHFETLQRFLDRGMADGSIVDLAPIPATQALLAMINWSYLWYGRIPIEQRAGEEITFGFGRQTAPDNVEVYNPAFDVTPARLIRAIITELGVISPVTTEHVKLMVGESAAT